MPVSPSAQIHPTAIVSAEAEIDDDVQIGAFAIIEGRVRLGAGCIIKPRAYLIGPLTMGRRNIVFSGAVLGEQPQHLQYRGEPTSLEIGDENVFRENVTIHRGTTHSWLTKIGNRNYFMANSHVGHDCRIGNACLLANGALIGGHCVLQDNAFISGNSAVHQFVRIGRLALLSGMSGTTKDIPPFVMCRGRNSVAGINVIGMRRAGLTAEQIHHARQAFRVIYREGLPLNVALDRLRHEMPDSDVVMEMIDFIRESTRGITLNVDRSEAA
ncbi:MAG: acyl-[acyl-carrier-protein]--UDP-N-acetylglucosamine O-acyltransferase [Gemmatales bacterium]|nr:MAG: acyl-[acyl-carrier-protein]--UDP-N-acetylglucosamine O-acyltransferase [Gemmatales bacterium]